MLFELKHNNSMISSAKLMNEYHVTNLELLKDKSVKITDASLVNSISMLFPDEVADILISTSSTSDKMHYASLFGLYEEGEWPDDLTPTEMLLTRLLWGEVDRYMAILCVAAMEDMSVEDVNSSLQKMDLF